MGDDVSSKWQSHVLLQDVGVDIGGEVVLATGTIDDRGQDVLVDEARTFEQDLVVMAGRVEPGERHDAAGLRARIRAAHTRLRMVAALGRVTGRELDALGLIAAGRTNPPVAATLGLTTHTVKGYVKSAMRELGAETRLEAVMLARRTGQLRYCRMFM
jgi:LuxR family transcriptional regulator, regulator of acetate metabolism